MTVYNLEYSILDSIGRSRRFKHKGIYATLSEVADAQKEILLSEAGNDARRVEFSIYTINNLFDKITQS